MVIEFKPKNPPRLFEVGKNRNHFLRDCGTIRLSSDEQVTFITEQGAEYDVTRKPWGFYATPSLNGRLKKFGLRGALVKGFGEKYFIHLVERRKVKKFRLYLKQESLRLICWLDDKEVLNKIETFVGKLS